MSVRAMASRAIRSATVSRNRARAGQAGSAEGEHVLEVDVSLEDLAQILGEELELPNIEDKGKSRIAETKDRYVGLRRTGPTRCATSGARTARRSSASSRSATTTPSAR